MSYKNIKFIPSNEYAEKIAAAPVNSARAIPDWYKNTSPFYMNGKEYQDIVKAYKDSYNENQFTKIESSLKICQPFIDALTSGYTIKLPTSVVVVKDNSGNHVFRWNSDVNLVDSQPDVMLGHFKAPDGYDAKSFRWINAWKIETPPGYSCLFTHPFNRLDLPFITLSGIVDTDMHPNAVVFPFFIKDDFEGVIEEGTPIVQLLPFKRDNWESEVLPTDDSEKYSNIVIKNSFIRTYKKKFWSKKIYK